jgi:hypothetical protein
LYYSLFKTVTSTLVSALLAASASTNSHKETLTDADWWKTNDRRVIITKVDDNDEFELIAGTSEELYNSRGAVVVSGCGS